MFKPLAFLCAAVVVLSCGKKSNTGVVLQTTHLYDAALNGNATEKIPGGSIVEYIDVMPIPSVPTAFFKVRVDNKEGYMDPAFACFGCTAAAVTTDSRIGSPATDLMVNAGTLVAFDSVKDGRSHVYAYLRNSSGWMPTSSLSTDPADVEVASVMNRLESATLDEDRFVAFASVVEQYPNNPLLQTINVNLTEAQEQDLADIQDRFGLIVNQKENKITTTRGVTSSLIEEYLKDILFITEDYGGEEYNSPRFRYYDRYMAALPSFVTLPAKSMGFSWDRPELADRAKAYLLFRLDRSPENISKLWSTYGATILPVLESGMVKDVRPYVQNLVSVYEYITAIPNHRALIQDISKKIAAFDKEYTGEDGYLTSMYTQIEQGPIYDPIIEESKYDRRNDGHAVWYHSFWVRRFSEGNEKVVYDILKEVANINPAPQEERADGDYTGDGDDSDFDAGGYEGEDERGDAETGEDYSAVTTYESCTFQEYSVGDCGHLVFSCGDFGDADISNLSEEEQAIWNDLILADSDGERGNPKYVGVDFYMEVGVTRGPACNDGQGGEGDVPKMIAFRLKIQKTRQKIGITVCKSSSVTFCSPCGFQTDLRTRL